MLLSDNYKLLDKIDMVTSIYLLEFDFIRRDALSGNMKLCKF